MPESTHGADTLDLSSDFPPVPSSEWEAALPHDKKLEWRTDEGIVVRPYYRSEHLPAGITHVRTDNRGWDEAQNFVPPADAIRADFLHEAGATAVQELGYALAEAAEKRLEQATLVFAVGSNYFFEIAKFRAARLLWPRVASAPLRIHVRTGRANKSIYDPYTNLLRATTEAMSAVIGGCDSLTVEPFGFDSHLASNVQRILREEARLGDVADPAAGSYYIEVLTHSLAHEAWKVIQEISAAGGWSKALQSGYVENALAASRDAKAKAVTSRRRTLVGINNYPNLMEKTTNVTPPSPLPKDPFPQVRLAVPFERIRERTSNHAAKIGRYPRVLLLKRGDLKMKTARANFCLNFFGCGGFDILESESHAGVAADLLVLCSSDPEYLAFAQDVCPKVRVPVLVAGNPKDQIDQLQAAGVQGFVHALSNAVETLTEWQNNLGMEAART